MSVRLCFRSARPCRRRTWWTARWMNVPWIKTALLTVQRLLLMNRSLSRGGERGFGVAGGLSIVGYGGVSECPPPPHLQPPPFQICLIHNGWIRISVLHLQLTVLVFSFPRLLSLHFFLPLWADVLVTLLWEICLCLRAKACDLRPTSTPAQDVRNQRDQVLSQVKISHRAFAPFVWFHCHYL